MSWLVSPRPRLLCGSSKFWGLDLSPPVTGFLHPDWPACLPACLPAFLPSPAHLPRMPLSISKSCLLPKALLLHKVVRASLAVAVSGHSLCATETTPVIPLYLACVYTDFAISSPSPSSFSPASLVISEWGGSGRGRQGKVV